MVRGIAAAAVIAMAAGAQAQKPETGYSPAPPAETRYGGSSAATIAGAPLGPSGAAPETRYNPAGTVSSGKVALLSVRRKSPEFPNIQLGLQAAALSQSRAAMNVAPLSAATLEEQFAILKERGCDQFLVDSPNPDDAREFFESKKALGLRITILSSSLPKGYNPPVVVLPEIGFSERVAEEAVRQVGNTSVKVAYVFTGNGVREDQRATVLEYFQRVFRNVAPKIALEQIDAETYAPTMTPPDVVCVLTAEDSRLLAPSLRDKFPKAKIVLAGDSAAVREAYEAGRADVILRSDYERLYANGLREAVVRSEFPIMLRAVAEKR